MFKGRAMSGKNSHSRVEPSDRQLHLREGAEMADDVTLGVHSYVRKGQVDPETGKPYRPKYFGAIRLNPFRQ